MIERRNETSHGTSKSNFGVYMSVLILANSEMKFAVCSFKWLRQEEHLNATEVEFLGVSVCRPSPSPLFHHQNIPTKQKLQVFLFSFLSSLSELETCLMNS